MSDRIDSSSSNREPGICDALVHRDQKAGGPVRLPSSGAEDFVAQFNRLYRPLGMNLQPHVPQPDSTDVMIGVADAPPD